MELFTNVWYKAINKMGENEWYNIFITIAPGVIEYISIGPIDNRPFYVEHIKSTPKQFKEEIMDNFEFEEESPSHDETKQIIEDIFK